MFKENDDKPYTGIVFDLSKSTGNKILEGRYKNGLKNGIFTQWNENEEIIKKGGYKSNLMNGEWNYFVRENTDLEVVVCTYDNGDGSNPKEFNDELDKNLFSNRENYESISILMMMGIPINGLTKVLMKWKNGTDKMIGEINLKNGYYDGITSQILNGQKIHEYTWKDGIGISGIEWYENGNKKS